MKITRAESWKQSIQLSRPYTIAYRTITAVDLFFVRLHGEEGLVGLGAASPAESVTGESPAACATALSDDRIGWLEGEKITALGTLTRRLQTRLADTPAARAAVDMALYDLFCRRLGMPVVDFLGRCHDSLPTSITIGIKSTDEALAEADEYLGRGFTTLKVKLGRSLEEDEERLTKLREHVGPDVRIRVDANQGYTVEQTLRFGSTLESLDLEFAEQPLPKEAVEDLRGLPESLRRRVAADESLQSERDALLLARQPAACGIYNIKLMKCGGITPALLIAATAEAADLHLMWGCMDESAVSIAAALHAAYACPATRYLDLDGSFDLATDPATGGFRVENGKLLLVDGPGLGVTLSGQPLRTR
jgi:L-alanine-DL-glutamate epimerase-like enolase superfamily enzyme